MLHFVARGPLRAAPFRRAPAALLLLGALTLAGCFSPKFANGQFKCGSGAHPCPDGYYCVTATQTCWQRGTGPSPDMHVAMAGDMGGDDMPSTAGPRHQGQACGPLSQCDTGFCVDGYCCDTACNNTCQACSVPGSLGICTNVPFGEAPAGARACNAEAMTTCGRDGKCDGDGNCRDWPSGTVCVPGTCNTTTGDFVAPSTCNGSGSCVANGSGNCAPFKCQDATQCFQTCSTSAQCSGTNNCAGGSCGLLPDGRTCSGSAQCQHGNCVDARCCNTACGAACQACDVSGNWGTCTTVPSGAPHGTIRTCTNLGKSICGGKCSGMSPDCVYAPTTQSCGVACTAGQLQNSFCDGSGTCTAKPATTCPGDYLCPSGGSACEASCSSNADCYTGYGCQSGTTQCTKICVFDQTNFDQCIFAP